jgi:predicted  nucleic acid-binding Zn-ribbon protein
MDKMNNLDASPGVIDYFWKLDQEIAIQEKTIRKQRNRIEYLESNVFASKKAKSLKNQVDHLQAKVDKMEAKHKRIVDAEKYYRYKMETIVHRLGIAVEVRELRKTIGRELKEKLGEDWKSDEYKPILQAEIPWRME